MEPDMAAIYFQKTKEEMQSTRGPSAALESSYAGPAAVPCLAMPCFLEGRDGRPGAKIRSWLSCVL